MKTTASTIIIIDDHPIIHDGLRTLLATEKTLSIKASAFTATEGMEILASIQLDLAIVDLSLADSDGVYLVQQIRSKHPKLRILVYSMSEETLFAERVASAGGNGYVMKTSNPELLKTAIHTVLSGDLYFSSNTLERIRNKQNGHSIKPQSLLDNLSNREIDVFKLIGQGLNAVTIGKKLDLSRNTIDTHRINIRNKLGLKTGKELDRHAYEVIKLGKSPKKK